MRRPSPAVLLASGLGFLASLYLPWRAPHDAPGNLTGWTAPTGYAAALLGVALVVAAVLVLLRPSMAATLPLGGLGISLAYFAAAVAVQLTAFAFPLGTYPGPSGWTGYGHLHWAWSSGFYLGGASGGLAGLAALTLRGKELLFRRTAADIVAAALGLGLLASFLLPWQGEPGPSAGWLVGLDSPAATIAAAGLLLGAGISRKARPGLRVAAATAAAVLAGAAANGIEFDGPHRYGTWIGIGCAAALVALEAVRARSSLRLPEAPGARTALCSGAAVLLLVALFLPWQTDSVGHRSISADGWQSIYGASAGVLAMLILVAPLVPWVARYAIEAAFGIACLVATLGVTVMQEAGFPSLGVAYGSYVGFVAATVLLLGALTSIGWSFADRRRTLARAVPVAACLACVGAVLVPAWQGVLPVLWTAEARAVRSWFAVAALLLALHLLRLWTGELDLSAAGRRLVVVPLLILPLPALELVVDRAFVVWGGVILVGLCLLLAVLGWIERGGGLERFRLPEVLWIDRLELVSKRSTGRPAALVGAWSFRNEFLAEPES